MANRTISKKIFAPRRQAGKEKSLSFSPNLASFAPLRESSLIRAPQCNFRGKISHRFD
jgi:hypothetical protein